MPGLAKENEIAQILVDVAFKIHQEYGPGLLESVYQRLMEFELAERKVSCVAQTRVPVIHKGVALGDAFVADLVVADAVIVEIKSIDQIAEVHIKQVLTYLKLAEVRLGILINFNTALIKDGIKRLIL